MKLLIVNGSPRANISNSKSIIERWMFSDKSKYDSVNAIDIFREKDNLDSMFGYDSYLFVFPLYVDSVPANLKFIFEKMHEVSDEFKDKKAYYIVHSGFPEACHSRGCEKYLEYFTSLMNMQYMGTGIFGGSESLKASPPDVFYKGKPNALKSMTESIETGQKFSNDDLNKLSDIEKLPLIRKIFMQLTKAEFYWNSQLKDNNAYGKREDKPLLD